MTREIWTISGTMLLLLHDALQKNREDVRQDRRDIREDRRDLQMDRQNLWINLLKRA